MSKILTVIVVAAIVLTACTNKNESQPQKEKIKMTSNSETYAKEDFEAVLKGQKPIHAVIDPKKPDLSDGGTIFYAGEGYSLTIKSTLAEKDGAKGYMYGPILTFENNSKEMSDVRFYSTEELKKLKGQ